MSSDRALPLARAPEIQRSRKVAAEIVDLFGDTGFVTTATKEDLAFIMAACLAVLVNGEVAYEVGSVMDSSPAWAKAASEAKLGKGAES